MATKLDMATALLDEILPPGAKLLVGNAQWHGWRNSVRGWAEEYAISWRTMNEAKRRAGNIRAVKQSGRHGLPWVWVRE